MAGRAVLALQRHHPWGIVVSFHRSVLLSLFAAAAAVALPAAPVQAQSAYFFPQATHAADFDPAIPTPQQFLGYEVGSRYTRHDQLVAYFKELARFQQRSRDTTHWAAPR